MKDIEIATTVAAVTAAAANKIKDNGNIILYSVSQKIEKKI